MYLVEWRTDNPSMDEFEEVESPFARQARQTETPRKEKLRTRRTVFDRPIGTVPSQAPTVSFKSQNNYSRRSLATAEDVEFLEPVEREYEEPEIEYLDEEEEEEEVAVVRKPRKSSSSKKKTNTKVNWLPRIGWSVVGLLVLRLIFMDRGVADYFSSESRLQEKREELEMVRKENKELTVEVKKIKHDRGFQKQLAKEHLGVIAADEFLILFAGESTETASVDSRQL
jgi:cell division protein FtsB